MQELPAPVLPDLLAIPEPPEKDKVLEVFDVENAPEHLIGYTPDEEDLIKLVDEWASQYRQLFPLQPDPLLKMRNEAGVEKFLPTFVRPTRLPYTEFYSWSTTAQYVAKYVRHAPMNSDLLLTPQYVLDNQIGDPLDLSVLLCSLLLGVGYEAYVCVGESDYKTATGDLSGELMPKSLDFEKEQRSTTTANPYSFPAACVLESKYLKSREAIVEQEQAKQAKQAAPTEIDTPAAFVLIRAGKKAVPEDFYVDALTGRRLNEDKLSIRVIFNDQLYRLGEELLVFEPITVLPPLELSEERYALRYPRGVCVTKYQDVTVTNYSLRPDGMVAEYRFSDRIEVEFEDRRDGLTKKIEHFASSSGRSSADELAVDGLMVEDIKRLRENGSLSDGEEGSQPLDAPSYTNTSHGAIEVIQEEHAVPETESGNQSSFYFDGNSNGLILFVRCATHKMFSFVPEMRHDMLLKRVITSTRILDIYQNRADHLFYRLINLSSQSVERRIILHGRSVTSIKERYIPPSEILEVIHNFELSTITIVHQPVEGSITKRREVLDYTSKDSSAPKAALLQKERAAEDQQAVIEKLIELDSEFAALEKELFIDSVLPTVYNASSIAHLLSVRAAKDNEAVEKTDEETDYLQPFLPDEYIGGLLTVDQAKQVKQRVMNDLAKRLLERSAIIEHRVEREEKELERRRLEWAKKTEAQGITREEEESFFAWQDEAHARICIAKDRLAKLEHECTLHYTQLHVKLRDDPRLANLYRSGGIQ